MEWIDICIVGVSDYDDIYLISSKFDSNSRYAYLIFYYLYGAELFGHDDEFYGKFFAYSLFWYGY